MQHIHQLTAKLQAMPMHVQLRRLRWAMPLFVLLLAALHQIPVHFAAKSLSGPWHDWVELLIYGVTGSVVAWIGLTWIAANVAGRTEAETQLRLAYAELKANHQELLTLHDLGQRIADANDVQALFEVAAQAPLRLTSARASTVVTFDNDRNRLKLDMAWGLSETYLRSLRARMDNGVDATRCRACLSLKTHAGSDCPLFVGLHAAAQAEGIGSLVCLPISHEQERVGVVAAYFPSADGPPEDQIRLLNILGGNLAAMLESLKMRTRQVDTLHALDRASQTTDTLGDFAAQVLDVAMSGWEAQAGGLFLYEGATQTWTCRARRGLGCDMTDPRFDLALQLAHQAQASGRPIVIPDVDPTGRLDLLSVAAAPLVAEGQIVGALFLGAKRRNALAERQAELLATAAHQIALAVSNAQLYAKVSQMAVFEERYRLSREIHDGLAQTLACLGLQTERLEKLMASGRSQAAASELSEMRQSIRAAYVDAREAIDGLRLSMDNPEQLGARLADYVTEFSRQTELSAHFAAEPEGLTTDPAIALQLLRITQEALTNVRKHACAHRVDVRLRISADELELTVTDDGRGFPNMLPPDGSARRYGLATMRERAEGLGGMLTIATGPGQGTRITVAVPLRGGR